MSGGGQKAPQGYQPTAQPWADQGYQDSVRQLSGIGTDLQGSVIPAYAQTAQSVLNSPYYPGAQAGANSASAYAMSQLAPMQQAGAASLYSQSGQTGAMASNIMAMQPGMANAYRTDASPYATGAADYSAINGQLSGAVPSATGGFGLATAIPGATASMMGQTTGGSQYADPLLQGSVARGAQGYDTAMSYLPATAAGLGYGAQVMGTAFDPQQALYDRSYHQAMEHQNAINAQNGVSGSPFAAGVSGDAARNFDTDWQSQQLARQIAGLGAWNQTASTAAGNVEGLIGAGTGAWNSGVNTGVGAYTGLTSNAANNYSNLLTSGTNAYNNLTNSATANLTALDALRSQNTTADFNSRLAANGQNFNQLLGANSQNFNQGQQALNSGVANYGALSALGINQLYGASDLGSTALNNYYTGSQLPNQTYLQQQQASFDALNAQTAGTNASASLTQQSADDYNNYLKTGQTATATAQNAVKINNDASAANMAGIGKLVGTVAGVALAPFTGGASLAMVGAAQGAGK